MEKLILMTVFFLLFLMSTAAAAQPNATALEFVAKTHFPEGRTFKGTVIGGLSGVFWDREKQSWIAVCGDRLHQQAPRFYEFKVKVLPTKKKGWALEVRPQSVTLLHEKAPATHEMVFDLKGVTQLPWGNYLISSEGANNLKPRVPPLLLDVKTDGTLARDFRFPDEYVPEVSGRQNRGVQNNRGPEGLTATPDGHLVWTAIEAPLLQEKSTEQIRILQYEMPEAWIIKPTKTYFYPLEESSRGAILSERGVSEISWFRNDELLVMERAFEVSMKSPRYSVKVFDVDLDTKDNPLKKKLVLDFKTLGVRVPNFEGLASGPDLPDGRKTLLFVSNNNFKKGEKTEFWLFAWKADP